MHKFVIHVSTEVHTSWEIDVEAEDPIEAEHRAETEAKELAYKAVKVGGPGFQRITSIEWKG